VTRNDFRAPAPEPEQLQALAMNQICVHQPHLPPLGIIQQTDRLLIQALLATAPEGQRRALWDYLQHNH
jgi:hypothetical protein